MADEVVTQNPDVPSGKITTVLTSSAAILGAIAQLAPMIELLVAAFRKKKS